MAEKEGKYEYRFIFISEDMILYKRGKVVHRNKKDIFRTFPCNFEDKIEDYPLAITRRENEITEKQKIDVLVMWNYPIIEDCPFYMTVPALTKALRYYMYDEE